MYRLLEKASRGIISEKKSEFQSTGVANPKPNPLMFKKKPDFGGTQITPHVYKSHEGPRVVQSNAYGSPANRNPLSRGPENHNSVIYRSPVNREVNLSRIVDRDTLKIPGTNILGGKSSGSVSNIVPIRNSSGYSAGGNNILMGGYKRGDGRGK